MFNLKYVIKVIILTLLPLALLGTPVYANQPISNQPKDQIEYFNGVLSNEPDAEMRNNIKKTLKLYQEMDQSVLKSLQSKPSSKIIPSPKTGIAPLTSNTNITLGTPYTFGYATEGDWGGANVTGISSYSANYNLNNNESLVKCNDWGYGDADAWAWNGRRFDVSAGTQQSQTAYFNVNGNYAASLTATGATAYASYSLDFKLYDATIGQYVATNNITVVGAASSSEGGQSQKTPMGPYNKTFSATLQAGHEYVALLLAEGTATNVLGTAQTDGYNPPTFYADWGSYTISF